MPEQLCNCNPPQPVRSAIVQKEGPNQGRPYIACPTDKSKGGCGLFVWTDQPTKGIGKGQARRYSPYPKPASPKVTPAPAPASTDSNRDFALKLLEQNLDQTRRIIQVNDSILQFLEKMKEEHTQMREILQDNNRILQNWEVSQEESPERAWENELKPDLA